MARTGLCDSRTLLDPKKTEERPPLRTWANTYGPRECRSCPDGDERRPQPRDKRITDHKRENQNPRWVRDTVQRLPPCAEDEIIIDYSQNDLGTPDCFEQEAVLSHLQILQMAPSLRDMLPGLLRKEMEVAMDKLGLLYDQSYAWDVFSDMMRSQLRCTLPNAELPRPFSENTRAILVDWLIQVHEVFNFSEETLYLAVHLLNRALRCFKVSVSSLQLLGVTCLFIAAKKEECLLPEISELCYLMANTYSKKQFLRMERRVLGALKFELYNCPPIHFLLLSAYIARCSDKVVCMARYLLELCLLEGQCVVYLPAQLAGAALHLARKIIKEPQSPESESAWCIASTIHVGSEATLHSIMQVMATAAARASSRETRATFVKFSTSATLQVSLHPALSSAPCLLGLQS
ncbi:cyclin N-terminal domain-containing protein 2 isoform X1 [Astyanax mexicanus]|uniref:Cyclin N-terminal domain-containing protein 2 isoform X1 n=1 Tax=Astyanax mexicanus TaxID=7994 RepID=A0A8B9L456_ASTMX|nr:cyclin N-terminal domain-containing protein 2 isoform X1 [Astyanax mexicanus]